MERKKILVTGGSGFIGSNFIKFILRDLEGQNLQVINLDCLTYAGKGRNLEHEGLDKDSRYVFVRGDISNADLVNRVFDDMKPKMVFNFAAESHVDNSINHPNISVSTNIQGTLNLLEASRKGIERFVQISTDEVYGSRPTGSFKETDVLAPSSPYSASKASAEAFVHAYQRTHGIPAVITRSSNNFGPYQFPEKLIPLFVTNLIDRKKVPLMWSEKNPGLNVRDWIYVGDNCRAIWHVANKGTEGEVYNIPGDNELNNTQITEMLLSYFGKGEEMIDRVEHRKGHDFRYSIDGEKLKGLGFQSSGKPFNDRLNETCRWYENHQNWWRPLK